MQRLMQQGIVELLYRENTVLTVRLTQQHTASLDHVRLNNW